MKLFIAFVIATIIAIVGLAPEPAEAACNALCRKKCQETASDVPACIRQWAEINKNPKRAREIEKRNMKGRSYSCGDRPC